jgi:hypothetical protein
MHKGVYTKWREDFVKYAFEKSSFAMIYISSFIKIDSRIHKLIKGVHRHTRQHGDRINLL